MDIAHQGTFESTDISNLRTIAGAVPKVAISSARALHGLPMDTGCAVASAFPLGARHMAAMGVRTRSLEVKVKALAWRRTR